MIPGRPWAGKRYLHTTGSSDIPRTGLGAGYRAIRP